MGIEGVGPRWTRLLAVVVAVAYVATFLTVTSLWRTAPWWLFLVVGIVLTAAAGSLIDQRRMTAITGPWAAVVAVAYVVAYVGVIEYPRGVAWWGVMAVATMLSAAVGGLIGRRWALLLPISVLIYVEADLRFHHDSLTYTHEGRGLVIVIGVVFLLIQAGAVRAGWALASRLRPGERPQLRSG